MYVKINLLIYLIPFRKNKAHQSRLIYSMQWVVLKGTDITVLVRIISGVLDTDGGAGIEFVILLMLLGLHGSLVFLLFDLEGNVKLALSKVANLSKSRFIDLSILLFLPEYLALEMRDKTSSTLSKFITTFIADVTL